LDKTYIQGITEKYQLRDGRFDWNNNLRSDEDSYPFTRVSGSVIGYFVWRPNTPGWTILTHTAPALAFALLVLGAVMALLIYRLKRASDAVRQHQEEIRFLAYHDPLTGLAARNLFNQVLDEALAARSASGLTLLYLDLDGFKAVNDTFGHPAVDELLKDVGSRLAGLFRATDLVARLGGDEFAALVVDAAGQNDIAALSHRIIEA